MVCFCGIVWRLRSTIQVVEKDKVEKKKNMKDQPGEVEPARYEGRLLTAKFVAEKLGLHEATIRRWANEGMFHCVKIGPPGKRQILRIRGKSLDMYLGDVPGE